MLATKVGATRIYKLTDIDYIYSSDPDKDPNATPYKKLNWKEYLQIFNVDELTKEHKPGANMPLDILASEVCMQNGIELMLAKGLEPENLGLALNQQQLDGTLVSDKTE